jgi:hypothetical protein
MLRPVHAALTLSPSEKAWGRKRRATEEPCDSAAPGAARGLHRRGRTAAGEVSGEFARVT